MALHILANPTGDLAEMESIEKRGCNTRSWFCIIANPSSYCINHCRAGSKYINCVVSYVSGHQPAKAEFCASKSLIELIRPSALLTESAYVNATIKGWLCAKGARAPRGEGLGIVYICTIIEV